MKSKKVLLSILWLSYTIVSNATNGIFIKGQVMNSAFDTIEVHYYPHVFYSNIQHPIFTAICDKNGCFAIVLPNVETVGSRIYILLKNGVTVPISGTYYLVEPGDSIKIRIEHLGKKVIPNFSGRGSAKYECKTTIDSILHTINFYPVNLNKNFYTEENIKKILTQLTPDSVAAFHVLKKYRPKISLATFEIMRYDLIGEVNLTAIIELINLYVKTPDSLKYRVIALYNNWSKANDVRLNKYVVYSNRFIDFVTNMAGHQITFEKKRFKYSVCELYEKLGQKYHGIFRDYLATNLLLFVGNRGGVGCDLDSLCQKAFRIMHPPSILQTLIAKQLDHKTKGSPAYNFQLPDANGRYVKLEHYKGKVVLIDFWFTGCLGCLSYSKRLEESLYPIFRNDSNVVFVSISGDRKKEQWLKSVQDHKYTRPENVNLYTEGLGFEHPLTKYYDFNGGPYSLLIDKSGKIFSGNPPTNDMETLIRLIKEALKTE